MKRKNIGKNNLLKIKEGTFFIILSSKHSGTNEQYKTALINLDLSKDECSVCKLSQWKGKFINLHLDHINGNNMDYSLTNLRLICPNCHSQTKNYGSKNKAKKKKVKKIDLDPFYRNKPRPETRKVIRPEKDQLLQLLNEKSIEDIGKMYKVSGNAVRKWCKSYKIEQFMKKRGYWAKVYAQKQNN